MYNIKDSIRKDLPLVLHASIAAFGTYFCMYAFRKPFTVGTFENIDFLDIDFKILLIITQVIGYALSKFIGIKVISELRPKNRLVYLFTLILMAELALVLFAIVPTPYNFIFIFYCYF